MSQTGVPSIDITPFLEGDDSAQEGEANDAARVQVAQQIDSTCRHHGFVHLPHRLNGMEEIFRAAKDLFNLPEEHKLTKLKRISPTDNMGYSPFASESLNRTRPPELKEAFNVRFPPAHTNQLDGCPASFVAAVHNLVLPQLRPLIRAYLHACAIALDLPPTYFTNTIERLDLCTVRFLHAPPCDVAVATNDVPQALRVGEHTDFGAVTFLFYDTTSAGLQIKPVAHGCIGGAAGGEDAADWVDVNVDGASGMLVNTGALMARWTNDVWRATAHRVVVPQDPHVSSCSRYAMAVFVDPDAEVVVDVHEKFVQGDETKRYEPITSLDFLLGKLKEAQGV